MVKNLSKGIKEKRPWYAEGLHFECAGCGGCCSGPEPGFIWLTELEIGFIAEYLKMSVSGLREKYLKRVVTRTTIIEDRWTNDCIFLKMEKGVKRCTIYPVRPNQCRTWPFWTSNLEGQEAWNYAAMRCKGMNRGKFYSREQIEQIKSQRKWWK